MVFTVSTKNYLGNKATIVAMEERGYETPALNVMSSGGKDFPGNAAALAANIASILNGNDPLHRIDLNHNRVFWQDSLHGIELRLQDTCDGGISQSCLFATIPSGNANPYYDQIRQALGPEGMKALCGTMQTAHPKPSPSATPGMNFSG